MVVHSRKINMDRLAFDKVLRNMSEEQLYQLFPKTMEDRKKFKFLQWFLFSLIGLGGCLVYLLVSSYGW